MASLKFETDSMGRIISGDPLVEAARTDPEAAAVLCDYLEDQGMHALAEKCRKHVSWLRKEAPKFKVGETVRWKQEPLKPFKIDRIIPGDRFADDRPRYGLSALYGKTHLNRFVSEKDLKRPRKRASYKRRRLY